MLLAIDAGNTNLVFALVDGQEIKARWRIATDPRRTADEYAVWLHQLLELEGYGRDDVEKVIIGTVVPRALHNLEVLSSKYFRVKPLVAGQGDAAQAGRRPDRDRPGGRRQPRQSAEFGLGRPDAARDRCRKHQLRLRPGR